MNGGVCCLCKVGEAEVVCDGLRDFEHGAPGVYRWLKCRGCGLIRLDPFPTRDVLALAYPHDYHAYVKPRSVLTRLLISRSRRKVARALASRLPEGGAILDVGCSTGELLEAVGKLGNYRLFGVEYQSESAKEARGRGIHV